MARVMVEQTEALCAEWRQDNVVDAGRAMRRLALRIGGISLFSHAFDDYEDRVGAALTDVMSHATSGIFGRLSEQFTSERMRRFQAARATLHAVADELIAQRSRETSDEAHDLFDMLAGSDECEALGARAELRDRVLTLLLAAQESTAIALTWALYLLASHPAVQSRLHDELDTVLGGRSCTVEDVRELPYTVAIFKEALRLFPPAWILGRRAREPVHVGGVSLPRGSAVYISPYVVHRDAHRYADALYFRPERWLQTPEPTAFSYLPFGRGARGCVGEPFAWMEGTIVLAVIASRFALSVVDDRPVPTSPLLTLRPARPIQLRVHALPTP
ncbi:MAG TPA: cytochrome P450, partial [Candidatus Acidoferrales bacterium]|nr:cytochrome P450 [Candidatus Acidoferrales bacterium]